MSKKILLIATMVGALLGASLARGQSLPQLNMGYSGAGIGSDLLASLSSSLSSSREHPIAGVSVIQYESEAKNR